MRRALLVVGIIAAAMLLVVLALQLLIDANQFRPSIESELAKSLGRDVKIGQLKLSILSGKVMADDLTVGDDPAFSQAPFLRTRALTLSIDLWHLLFTRRLSVNEISIDTPAAMLIQSPAGVWNFSTLGTKSSVQPQAATTANSNLTLSMKSLNVNAARLTITQGAGQPQILDNVTIKAKDFAPGSVFPFSLSASIAGGGSVALDGKAGPINPADAANTPITAALKVTDLGLAASGAVTPSSGIDSVISADGTVSSNGQTLDVTAHIKADKLKLAPGGTVTRNPLTFDAAFTEDLKQHAGQFTRGDIAIGSVKASLNGTWTSPAGSPVPTLNMTLSASSVPVSGLTELLPALAIKLPAGSSLEGGSATAKLALTGPSTAVMISGPVSVHNARLKGFDLGARMSPVEKLAGLKSGPDTEVQTFSADLLITPQRTTLKDIHLVLPSVAELSGAGTINPDHTLDFNMKATVHANVVISTIAPPNIPFIVTGTSADPQFRPEVGQLAEAEINRGVGVGKTVGKTTGKVLKGLFGGKN